MRITKLILLMATVSVGAAENHAAAQSPQSPLPRGGATDGSTTAIGGPWQQTLRAFDEWAQIQQTYTAEQITDMRRRMLEKAVSATPAVSEQFRAEINAKLQLLMGAEARDARRWLAATLAVASDSYAQKVRAQLPDVTKDSPAQLQAALDAFEARETTMKQYQQGLDQTRQMQIRAIQDSERRQAEANAQAHVGSNYNPAPGGAPSGVPNANLRYYSPYRPIIPYGFGLRYW